MLAISAALPLEVIRPVVRSPVQSYSQWTQCISLPNFNNIGPCVDELLIDDSSIFFCPFRRQFHGSWFSALSGRDNRPIVGVPNKFSIFDRLLFPNRATQGRLGSKINVKFCNFSPMKELMGGTSKMSE